MKMSTTISISDFKTYRKDNYYYVDKTLLIEELFTKGDQVTLLPRPRRFGKTLNLSMLKYYFDINEDSKELFKGLNIEKSNLYEKHLNKYPTIFLTLKDVKGNDWKSLYSNFKFAISNLYKEHKYLLDSNKLEDYDKELINKIIRRGAEEVDYKNSLYILSEYMYKHYGKEVVVLLDEYDTPVNSIYNEDVYNNIINLIRVFIGSAFKGNQYLFKGIITGILRIAKESIFSGANNIMVRTILSKDFSDKFGFTDNEVVNMLKYNNLEDKIDEVREWYNGYTFGNTTIYNPFSIAGYVQEKELKAYWVRSGGDTLIKNLLISSDIAIKEKLEELIKGNNIEEEIEENILFNQLNNKKYLWSLLLFSGYLKIVDKVIKNDRAYYKIAIVNKEVKDFYISIIEDYFNILTNNSLKIIDYIKNGNIKLFGNELKRIVMNITSNHDIKYENSFHMLMISFFYYLEASGEYKVKSNIESGDGRYDICIIPNDKNKLGYVIELKKSDTDERVKEWANIALNQIEEKEYYTELVNNNVKNILLVGLAFKGKIIHIVHKNLLL